MAVEGKLTGWIELVSATELTREAEILAFFDKLAKENKSLEVNKGAFSSEEASFTCWDEPAPNFASALKPLVDLLEMNEYLYFEEKVRIGDRGRSLRAILVSGVGVFKAEENALVLLLQQRDIAMKEIEDDNPDIDDDDLDVDEEADAVEAESEEDDDPDEEPIDDPDDSEDLESMT